MTSPIRFMDTGRTHVIPGLETKDRISEHGKQHGINMLASVPLDTPEGYLQTCQEKNIALGKSTHFIAGLSQKQKASLLLSRIGDGREILLYFSR